MNVIVNIPPATLWGLEQAAERRGMTLPEFLVRSAEAVTGSKNGVDSWLVLYRAGFTDKAIGQRLNMTNAAVQRHRLEQGLPANKRTRKAN